MGAQRESEKKGKSAWSVLRRKYRAGPKVLTGGQMKGG